MSFKGNNSITVNEVQLIDMVQEWLDRSFVGPAPTVNSVSYCTSTNTFKIAVGDPSLGPEKK